MTQNTGVFSGLSMSDKAEMVRIGNKPGHHFYFENTMEYTKEIDFPMPSPKRIGYTARIFIFIATKRGFAEMKMRNSRGYCLSCRVRDGNLAYASERQGNDHKQKEVKDTGYYAEADNATSLAVRIESDTHLSSWYDQWDAYKENVGDTMNGDFRIYIKVEKHRLLSLHVTVETNEDNEPWASDSLLWDRALPLQTSIIYTVRPKKDKPSDLYIELPGKGDTKATFTNDVKKGQRLVFMVRLASNCLVVTNNFDQKKPFTVLQRVNDPYIKAKFHNDLEILMVEGNLPVQKPA
ncbi:uncharacterized protein LOC144107555 [Amblyomma americanum]